MDSTVKTSGLFSKSRGLQASVPFFPLPHLPSTFLLSLHFPHGPNDSFARQLRSLRTGTLGVQAMVNHLPIPIVVLEPYILYQGLELKFLLVVSSFQVFLTNPSEFPFYCYTPKTLIQSLKSFCTCLNIAFLLF